MDGISASFIFVFRIIKKVVKMFILKIIFSRLIKLISISQLEEVICLKTKGN